MERHNCTFLGSPHAIGWHLSGLVFLGPLGGGCHREAVRAPASPHLPQCWPYWVGQLSFSCIYRWIRWRCLAMSARSTCTPIWLTTIMCKSLLFVQKQAEFLHNLPLGPVFWWSKYLASQEVIFLISYHQVNGRICCHVCGTQAWALWNQHARGASVPGRGGRSKHGAWPRQTGVYGPLP